MAAPPRHERVPERLGSVRALPGGFLNPETARMPDAGRMASNSMAILR